jgi:hypothetical protein
MFLCDPNLCLALGGAPEGEQCRMQVCYGFPSASNHYFYTSDTKNNLVTPFNTGTDSDTCTALGGTPDINNTGHLTNCQVGIEAGSNLSASKSTIWQSPYSGGEGSSFMIGGVDSTSTPYTFPPTICEQIGGSSNGDVCMMKVGVNSLVYTNSIPTSVIPNTISVSSQPNAQVNVLAALYRMDGTSPIPLPGLELGFLLGNDPASSKLYSAVTNGNGQASATITAPPSEGTYIITPVYNCANIGSTCSQTIDSTSIFQYSYGQPILLIVDKSAPPPSNNATTLSVGSSISQPNQVVNLTAQLTQTNNGNPLNGEPVTFSIQGSSKSYDTNTNSNGIASISYTAPATEGTYKISVSFAGDSSYLASSGNGTLTVSQNAPSPSNESIWKRIWDWIKANAILAGGLIILVIILLFIIILTIYEVRKYDSQAARYEQQLTQ